MGFDPAVLLRMKDWGALRVVTGKVDSLLDTCVLNPLKQHRGTLRKARLILAAISVLQFMPRGYSLYIDDPLPQN